MRNIPNQTYDSFAMWLPSNVLDKVSAGVNPTPLYFTPVVNHKFGCIWHVSTSLHVFQYELVMPLTDYQCRL